jgi:sugar lactone lactonase YvrE
VLVIPEGTVGQVAGDLAFPNGMAISPDGAALVVAESYASRLTAYDIGSDGGLGSRRVWAGHARRPPGRNLYGCQGAVWYADVVEGRSDGRACSRITGLPSSANLCNCVIPVRL